MLVSLSWWSFAALWSFAGGLAAQTGQDAPPALRAALQKLEDTTESRVRFTYRNLSHTQNFNEKGKRTADFTQLFDVTYIAGLEFARLLEIDGKPLQGKALREEQERYERAVRERSALDGAARAKLQHRVQKSAGIDLEALASGYHARATGEEQMGGRTCLVIDAVPGERGGAKSYRLWLDAAHEQILRLDFNQLTDEGEMLRGAQGTKLWTYLEGVPLTTHSVVDATFALGGKGRTRVLAEHTYTDFRRFSATATMVSADPE